MKEVILVIFILNYLAVFDSNSAEYYFVLMKILLKFLAQSKTSSLKFRRNNIFNYSIWNRVLKWPGARGEGDRASLQQVDKFQTITFCGFCLSDLYQQTFAIFHDLKLFPFR